VTLILFCPVLNIPNPGGCSGFNAISATCGSIKFVLCLMVGEMKGIVNTFVRNVVA
jgi:hypothetical protein